VIANDTPAFFFNLKKPATACLQYCVACCVLCWLSSGEWLFHASYNCSVGRISGLHKHTATFTYFPL